MLKVVKLELRKSVKKYSRKFIFITVLLTALSGFLASQAINSGIDSDRKFYTLASPFYINDEKFVYYRAENGAEYVKEGKIDVFLGKGSSLYILLSNSERGKSAADELRKSIKNSFENKLWELYGERAFPVFVDAIYIKRDIVIQPEIRTGTSGENEDTEKSIKDVKKKIEETKIEEKLSIDGTNENKGVLSTVETGYKTPDEFNPPSLIGKMIYAFFFVLPSYFAIQVFSSSLIEDRIAKRIDVLLSTPVSETGLLAGKLLPYVVISIFTVIITSLLFDKSPITLIYIFPIIFFFATLQMFIALISRSYREMTFLVIASSLIVTSYIFIPSIFGGAIPVSKVSPITLMLASFEGESVSLSDYAFATFQFYSMGIVLFYLSAKALNPEVIYRSDISGRLLAISRKTIKKDYHTFIAAMASIPFVFMTEFLLLSILFIMPLDRSIPVFLFVVAFVEEMFKGTAVYAAKLNGANLYRSAVFCALGFFLGEKLILVLNIATQFNSFLFAGYLLLPLLIHTLSILVFTLVLRKSFIHAILASTITHFVYNYAVVVLML